MRSSFLRGSSVVTFVTDGCKDFHLSVDGWCVWTQTFEGGWYRLLLGELLRVCWCSMWRLCVMQQRWKYQCTVFVSVYVCDLSVVCVCLLSVCVCVVFRCVSGCTQSQRLLDTYVPCDLHFCVRLLLGMVCDLEKRCVPIFCMYLYLTTWQLSGLFHSMMPIPPHLLLLFLMKKKSFIRYKLDFSVSGWNLSKTP